MQKHYFQVPEQNDWEEFKPLFGGGKVKICDTLRAARCYAQNTPKNPVLPVGARIVV